MSKPITTHRLAEVEQRAQRAMGPDVEVRDAARYWLAAREVPALVAEIRRLRAQAVAAEDAENTASCEQDTRIRGLEQENDLLRAARDLAQAAPASVWWVKGDDVFPADPDLHATERAAKDDAIRIYRVANQIDLFGDPVPDFAWRPDRDGGVELYADGTAMGLIVRELAVKPPCVHVFPPPTGDADPDAEGYGPGNCTSCGMTYRQYDAGHGERMAEALEGGA